MLISRTKIRNKLHLCANFAVGVLYLNVVLNFAATNYDILPGSSAFENYWQFILFITVVDLNKCEGIS